MRSERPDKSKWLSIGEMLLMVLLGAAIFFIPRFHDASNERLDSVISGTNDPFAPAQAADIPLEFIDHAVVEISSWNTDRIAPLLSDETNDSVSGFELDSVTNTLGYALGDLETYSYPQPVELGPEIDRATEAATNVYLVDARYESGAADIVLHIVEEDGEKALRKLDLMIDDSEQDI